MKITPKGIVPGESAATTSMAPATSLAATKPQPSASRAEATGSGAPPARPPRPAMTEQRAAGMLLDAHRRKLANDAQRHMLARTAERQGKLVPTGQLDPKLQMLAYRFERGTAKGADVKAAFQAEGLEFTDKGKLWRAERPKVKSIESLSAANMQRLRSDLGPLDRSEQQFLDGFVKQKLYGTHFTNTDKKILVKHDQGVGQDVAALHSRQGLIHRGIKFPTQNSMPEDIVRARNDDYVFLALECGADPKKDSSRFGKNRLRFDLDQPQFDKSWVSLNDMVLPKQNSLERYVPGLPKSDYARAAANVEKYNKPAYVFARQDMKEGMALSMIEATRGMSPEARKAILEGPAGKEADEHRMDQVMNGLFRPELKVPRYLISKDFEFESTKP